MVKKTTDIISKSLSQDYVEMMKILANNLMEEEIERKCGGRYSHDKPEGGDYSRREHNPGSTSCTFS